MRRGKRRAPRGVGRRRPLRFEALDARHVLDASFGFITIDDGFAFQISGTDFETNGVAEADNAIIWTSLVTLDTNFFVEWVDEVGSWNSLSGSVSTGDIADEAADRGFQPGHFKGFFIKLNGGGDTFHADGGGQFGALSGAPLGPIPIETPFLGPVLTIDTNDGNDTIFGSPSNDVIRAGPGSDVVHGLSGRDTIFGNSGDDELSGGDKDDFIDGGPGDDMIRGDAGSDVLLGADGHDTLIGGTGDDTLEGGDEDDDLDGGAGGDKLVGGEGNDSLLGDGDDKNPEGGPGVDTFQAGPTTTKGITILNKGIEKVDTTGADPGEPSAVPPFSTSGPFGSFGPFAFNDHVESMGWTANGVPGLQIFTGGGDDRIWGSDKGNDQLDGGDGSDQLDGRAGEDTLWGGNGSDTLIGGPGADVINGDGGQQPGIDGTDVASYKNSVEAVNVDLDPKNNEDDTDVPVVHARQGSAQLNGFPSPGLGGGDAQGDIIIKVGPHRSTVEGLEGSAFDDLLIGDDFDNDIFGLLGHDEIRGMKGNDWLNGGDGDDTLYGAEGADTIQAGKGNDELYGGEGFETDILTGDGGDDFLDPGLGVDLVSGGSGRDILVAEYGFVADTDGDSIYDAYTPGIGDGEGELIDLLTDRANIHNPQGRLFGDHGIDRFVVFGATGGLDEFDVRFELISGETFGLSDYDANADLLEMD